MSGIAAGADTARFNDRLKAAHNKKADELERLAAQLQKDKQRKDKEIGDLTKHNKQLRQDFDKTPSKEKLAELIQD